MKRAGGKVSAKFYSTVLPYLLLVSFYSGNMNSFDSHKIKSINESPYHGVAVGLVDAYDTGDHRKEDFEAAFKRFNKESRKHIWPWVFFNRFIGFGGRGSSLGVRSDNPYFSAIKGMDLYDEAGALVDFKDFWKISLMMAKDTGSPGIVVDPEPYNNYRAFSLKYVADEMGRPEDEIVSRLKLIGNELADIAAGTYPEATIWFLFTGFAEKKRSFNPFSEGEYRTVTYIVKGMLERTKEKKYGLKIVSGGELSLGYCYDSIDDMKAKMTHRDKDYLKAIRSYPALRLGGTIAPWDRPDIKTGWMSKGKCKESQVESIRGFEPYIRHLLNSYDYVWLYAASAAAYDPYDRKISFPYNKVIYGLLSAGAEGPQPSNQAGVVE